MLVYVSAPYSAGSEEECFANVQVAIDASIDLQQAGIHSVCPHLSHFIDLRAKERGIEISWEAYLEWDLELLEPCDCLLLLGTSKGCLLEEGFARELGKPVFATVEEVVAFADQRVIPNLLATQGQLSLGF